MKSLAFGEVLWDVYPDKKYIGGAPFNFAAHLARHGHESFMLTSVGDDDLGREAIGCLKENGIKPDYALVCSQKPTGSCVVTLGDNAVPTYDLKSDVAYDYISTDDVRDDFDVLYFGSLALRGQYNRDSIKELLKTKSFGEVMVDVNLRPPFYSREALEICLANATILKLSDEELGAFMQTMEMDSSQSFPEQMAKAFPYLKLVVLTLGGEGAVCYDLVHQREYRCEGQKVEVVSTVGAGDSFCAAFLHCFVKGCDIDECLLYASKVAGFVVANYDAVPSYCPEDF